MVKSLNNSIRIANGYYIARMDADDISDLKRLEKQIIYMELNKLDIVTSNIEFINEYGKKRKIEKSY